MENMDNLNWEDFSPTPADPGELKKIQKSIRKRHWLTVLTSVVLVAVLIFGAVQYGIPALESRYWDPTESTYLEGVPDVELTMVTYNELFGMGQQIFSVDITKNGFADYTLDTTFLTWKTMRMLTSQNQRSSSIVKGEFDFDQVFWDINRDYGLFNLPESRRSTVRDDTQKSIQKKLAQLPEYVELLACVSFPEYLTMEQLLSLKSQYESNKVNFLWAVLQTNSDGDLYPLCGVHLYQYNTNRYDSAAWTDTDYPRLFLDLRLGYYAKYMEQHVKSMLRFSADQIENGTGIVPMDADADYYENTLAFMEENGVKSYGCYVIATPAKLLEMLENGVISSVYLQDAWLSF